MADLYLENVVIVNPALFQMHQYQNNQPKYQAEFLVDPGSANHQKLDQAFMQTLAEAGVAEQANYIKRPYTLGEEVNARRQAKGKAPLDYVAGKLVVTAKDGKYRPVVRLQDGVTDMREEDQGNIFGGCLVNAFIRTYWSKENPGVWVGLNAVQLVSNVNVKRIESGSRPAVAFKSVEGAPAPVNTTPGAVAPAADKPSWL